MPQQARSKFNRHLLPGFCSGFAIALALFSLDPALAASLDCPKARPPFLADGVWRVNDSVTAKNLRILAIGSSSTEGIGASAPAFTYPAQLQVRLAILLGRPVEVDNSGVGGETVAKTVVRLKAALAASKPDLVIWQVGTNDAVIGEDEASFRASLLDGVAAIRAAKTPFVLLDPQFYPGLKDAAHYEQYVQIIRRRGRAQWSGGVLALRHDEGMGGPVRQSLTGHAVQGRIPYE